MKYMRVVVGDAAWVLIDANQSAGPITLYDGPIESQLQGDLGNIFAPSRLYGYVWTSGPQAVIRYYAAHRLDGGDEVPICAVARLGLGQLKKLPQSKPGTAVLEHHRATVYVVDQFR